MQIREGLLAEALEILAGVPELEQGDWRDDYNAKLQKAPHLILVASHGQINTGFKIGYAHSSDHFHSWLGGVIPGYRRLGVASGLLHAQEEWVWSHRYRCISVTTSARFPAMIAMLSGNRYQQVASNDGKLLFLKTRTDS